MIFGGMCTVASVLMIDLPMPIIVENFANYYNHLQARSKFPKKLRRKVLDIQAPRLTRHHHGTGHMTPSNTMSINAVGPSTSLSLHHGGGSGGGGGGGATRLPLFASSSSSTTTPVTMLMPPPTPSDTIALMTNKFGAATVSLLKRDSIVNPTGISKLPKMA